MIPPHVKRINPLSCREDFPNGVTSGQLVNLTIQFFNTEPRVMEKLKHVLDQHKVKYYTVRKGYPFSCSQPGWHLPNQSV
jgi:hypothetical protein